MIKEFNDFENKNVHLLTQYYDKVMYIEQNVDFDINNLTKFVQFFPEEIEEKDKLAIYYILSKIESKNIVNKMELSNILVEIEKIIAFVKAFVEEKSPSNTQITVLKNSLMQNLISKKEMVEENIGRVKSKIFQLSKIIKKMQNENTDVDKESIKKIINQEIKLALKSYEVPLKKITKFNEIETCNTIDCLKAQLNSTNQQIIEQNEAIKKISGLYAEEIDKIKQNIIKSAKT